MAVNNAVESDWLVNMNGPAEVIGRGLPTSDAKDAQSVSAKPLFLARGCLSVLRYSPPSLRRSFLQFWPFRVACHRNASGHGTGGRTESLFV